MSRLLACLALATLATPAVACHDDTDSTREREFRSAYGEQLTPPATEGVTSSLWILGGGIALLAGAAALVSGAKGE